MSSYWQSNSPPDVPHPNLAPHPAAPPPPSAPGAPYWYMSPAQQLAAAQAQAQAMFAPVLAAYAAQQQRQQRAHQAQQGALGAVFDALTNNYANVGGQLKGIFDQAAGNLSKYSQGSTSPDLGVMQQGLQGQGAAAAYGAGALPALSRQRGTLDFLKAVQDAQAEDQALADQQAQVEAQMPGQVQSALSGIQGQQFKYAQQQATQDRYTQQQSNTDRTYQLQQYNALQATAKQLYNEGYGTYVVVNTPKGLQLQKVSDKGKPGPAKKQPTNTGPYYIDPVTHKPVLKPGYKTDAQGNVVKVPPAAKPHQPTNTGPYFRNPVTNEWELKPGYTAKPDGTVLKNGKPVKFTAGQRKQAFQLLDQAKTPKYFLPTEPTKPLSLSQLRGLVADFNKKKIAEGAMTTKTVNGKKKNVPFKENQVTVAELAHLDPGLLADIGVVQHRLGPQEVYEAMVHEYGIPARRAWEWVRRVYPKWGAGYFK